MPMTKIKPPGSVIKAQSAALVDARAIVTALRKKGVIAKGTEFKGLTRISKETGRDLARVQRYSRKYQGVIQGYERVASVPKQVKAKFDREQKAIRKAYNTARKLGDTEAAKKYYSQLHTRVPGGVVVSSENYITKKGAVRQRGHKTKGIYTVELTGEYDVDSAAIQKVINRIGPVVARTTSYRVFAHGVAFASGDFLLDWIENEYTLDDLDALELMTHDTYDKEMERRYPYRNMGKKQKTTERARKALGKRYKEKRRQENKQYYTLHKSKEKARMKEYYHKNKDKILAKLAKAKAKKARKKKQ